MGMKRENGLKNTAADFSRGEQGNVKFAAQILPGQQI